MRLSLERLCDRRARGTQVGGEDPDCRVRVRVRVMDRAT